MSGSGEIVRLQELNGPAQSNVCDLLDELIESVT